MKSRKILSLLLGVGASVAVGSVVVSQLHFQDVAELWSKSQPVYLALGLATYFSANVLRARRFRALTGDLIPTRVMLRTVIIQNILNTFLPLRAGEVSYLYAVHRSGVVKAGDNVGSLLGARVLDLLAALILPLFALPWSRAWAAEGHAFLWLAVLAGAGAAAFAFAIWRAELLASFFRARQRGDRAWLDRAFSLIGDVLSSLAQLRRSTLLSRVAALTAGCWGLVYLSGYFSLVGVGVRIPIPDAVFAYSFPVVASMTPLYMLGGFGVYEGSFGVGLHLAGVPVNSAVASALLLHIVELLFVIGLAPVALALSARLGPEEKVGVVPKEGQDS
jgi:uncharacterized membrane protein YbhN (UPF0104 family)